MTDQISTEFQELDACFERAIEDFNTVSRRIEALLPLAQTTLQAARERPYCREQHQDFSRARDDESALLHLNAQLASMVRTMLHDRARLNDINTYRLGERSLA